MNPETEAQRIAERICKTLSEGGADFLRECDAEDVIAEEIQRAVANALESVARWCDERSVRWEKKCDGSGRHDYEAGARLEAMAAADKLRSLSTFPDLVKVEVEKAEQRARARALRDASQIINSYRGTSFDLRSIASELEQLAAEAEKPKEG
jgi:hypothetical protein